MRKRMECIKVLQTRRSIRSYTDRAVSEEHVESVIRAAMTAPSAGNQQPWHFIIIRKKNTLEAIPSFHPFAQMVPKAQVAILICGDPDGRKWPAFWDQDCSAATQNLLLAARDLGLGTVWTGVFPDEDRMAGFRNLLNIPNNIHPFALVPMGWPDAEFKEMNRYNPELIRQESW